MCVEWVRRDKQGSRRTTSICGVTDRCVRSASDCAGALRRAINAVWRTPAVPIPDLLEGQTVADGTAWLPTWSAPDACPQSRGLVCHAEGLSAAVRRREHTIGRG